jgi:ArsR family transcriptional regulator, virulence genes transcriptional regulator
MNTAKMKASAAAATALLKALANPHRLLILCHLANGEQSVGELEALLGVRQPHLSQHLARLRRDALVRTRRNSRTIYYRINSSAAAQVLRLLYDLYCSRRAVRRAAGGGKAGGGRSGRTARRGRAAAVSAAARRRADAIRRERR